MLAILFELFLQFLDLPLEDPYFGVALRILQSQLRQHASFLCYLGGQGEGFKGILIFTAWYFGIFAFYDTRLGLKLCYLRVYQEFSVLRASQRLSVCFQVIFVTLEHPQIRIELLRQFPQIRCSELSDSPVLILELFFHLCNLGGKKLDCPFGLLLPPPYVFADKQ